MIDVNAHHRAAATNSSGWYRGAVVVKTAHGEFQRFLMDAARWVRPEEVADRSELSPVVIARLLFQHTPLRAMAWFRLASWLQAAGVRVLPSMIQRHVLFRYGMDVPPGRAIGGGLYVAHPVACTIVVERMGENCSIMGPVTFGRSDMPKWPTIGDRVFVGSGARIIGMVEVGDDAVIGANAVVVKPVPARERVAGVPARIIGGPEPGGGTGA